MPRPSLSIAKDGPVDHVAACRDHLAKAREHAQAAEAEIVSGIRHNAAVLLKFAALGDPVKAGVREECRQLAEVMEAAAQRIGTVSAKGGA